MTVVKREVVGPKGKLGWTCQVTGEVKHTDRAFETIVRSSGGGGSVGPNGGYVSAPRLDSTSVAHQNLFVRDDSGAEHSFAWSGWTLPVRSGNRVSVMWGGPKGANEGKYLAAANLDTGDTRENKKGMWEFASALYSYRPHLVFIFVVALIMAYFTWDSFLSSPVAGWAYRVQKEKAQSVAFTPSAQDAASLEAAQRALKSAQQYNPSWKEMSRLSDQRTAAEAKIERAKATFYNLRERSIPLELDTEKFLMSEGKVWLFYLAGIWVICLVPALIVETLLFAASRTAEIKRLETKIGAELAQQLSNTDAVFRTA